MAIMRHNDFEVGQWGEFAAGPRTWVQRAYSDDFNRPNGPLENSANWIKQGLYPMVVAGNMVQQGSPIAGIGFYRWNAGVGDDQFSEADVINPAYNSVVGVAVRLPASGSGGYFLDYTPAFGRYRIWRGNANGTFTALSGVSGMPDPRGHRFRLEAVGHLITLYREDVSYLSATDATWPSGGVGIGIPFGSPIGINLDNWRGGEL